MKYVSKGTVVKEVSDNIEADYVAAGWKLSSKEEYERKLDKPISERQRGL